MTLMHAVIRERYCGSDGIELAKVEAPAPGDGQVLVRVRAASMNPVDWHTLTGTPLLARSQTGWRRPAITGLGTDVAGTIEAVGPGVDWLRPGDAVFGATDASFAELVCASARSLAIKPAEVTFEQAAAVPVAATTALQALRDKGRVRTGQRVLVIGASGGVGTFAVQIARSLGAHVTGVCSTANVELVRSLGADDVVDYTRDDFAERTNSYDVIVDNVGTHSMRACKRVLTGRGTYVLVGGPKRGRIVGALTRMVQAMVAFSISRRRAAPMLARITADDLRILAGMLAGGTITPVIEHTYRLDEVGAAFRHLEKGHTKGKLVVVP